MDELPLKPIKRIMERSCPYHIRNSSIEKMRDILIDIANQISLESIKEFKELNDLRERHGLRRLKRLHPWSIQKASRKVLKGIYDSDMGSQPEKIGSQGGKMLASMKSTKSVGGER
jgi:hypothetical protein